MSPIPTLAECIMIVVFFIIFLELRDIRKVLKEMAVIMRTTAVDPDSVIECPICSTDSSFWEIEWRENEPDVGDCPNCHTVWQNLNTRDDPTLKVVKLP